MATIEDSEILEQWEGMDPLVEDVLEDPEAAAGRQQMTRRAVMVIITAAVAGPGAVQAVMSARHRKHLREYCGAHAAEIDRWFASDLASLHRERERTEDPLAHEVLTEIIRNKAALGPGA
ncbi:MAG: hypothetical protein WCV62_04775 [Candidatus Peribacteraceae bacterium]|jgi:hypothetical protein